MMTLISTLFMLPIMLALVIASFAFNNYIDYRDAVTEYGVKRDDGKESRHR